MKNKGAEQNWWAALSGWLHRHQGRADFLFVYDREQGRLNRCFDRNVALDTVDAETVSKLYQAAAEGRLGLLRPNDLKPQRLTADPKEIVAPEKETAAAEKAPAAEEKAPAAEQPEEQKRPENAAAEPAPEERKPVDPKPKRPVVEQAVTDRMREAEAQYRQVIYAPPKADNPAPVEAPNPAAGKMRMYQMAALEQIVATIRNAVPAQEGDGSAQAQEQLIAALAQMVLGIGKAEDQDEERREREQRAREELLAAQNQFIWASASDKRDQAAYEAHMDWLDDQQEKLAAEMERLDREWKHGMEDMSRELCDLDLAGAGEEACKEKIRDYLDGKRPAKRHEPADREEERQEAEATGEMWGNALRHFCRFAASEVPLSVRHVQVAAECQKIIRAVKERSLTLDDLGLNREEQLIVKGTIEMGKLVAQGIVAQATLTTGHRLPKNQYRECLKDYLAMKGVEESLIPHVQTYQKEISVGDGPVSAMQVLMANPGFHANDLRAKAGRTTIVTQLEGMDPHRVARMIRQDSEVIADMGRRVMVASCQMGAVPEPVREPAAPQKGGPVR